MNPFPVSVASTPATWPLKQTAGPVVEHKQEVRSLNLNLSLQACTCLMSEWSGVKIPTTLMTLKIPTHVFFFQPDKPLQRRLGEQWHPPAPQPAEGGARQGRERQPRTAAPASSSWLPDGDSQIFRSYVSGPSGLKDYGSATLRCKI